MQVTNSVKKVTPFGGINFIYQAIKEFGLPDFLDKEMGRRSIYAKYTNSDIVFALLAGSLTQSTFLSDLETVKDKLAGQHYSPNSFAGYGRICVSGVKTTQSENNCRIRGCTSTEL